MIPGSHQNGSAEAKLDAIPGTRHAEGAIRQPGWRRASRAFTLIELLVVIAIIGILAAMLFPVFARARESARKTQCLANVKNIAIAFQMYLADYDRMVPQETRSAIVDFYADGGDAPSGGGCDGAATAQNPKIQTWNDKGPAWGAPDACMITLGLNTRWGPMADAHVRRQRRRGRVLRCPSSWGAANQTRCV